MCGIAGLIRYGERAGTDIERMKERMLHRGPDAGGTWRSEDGDVFFGHRRLAVLDLTEAGAQPMVSESGRFIICYNGEVYNHALLRKALREKGVSSFRGSSDTESLLSAFEHLGIEKTLSLIKGMFALALYDAKEKELFLIRDRVGQKPLYYGFIDEAFVFASDIGCIRVLSRFRPEINSEVTGLYLRHGYIPAPHSVYRGIYKLSPGCVLKLKAPFAREALSVTPYWEMTAAAEKGRKNPFRGSAEEAADELERLLRAAVKEQMVADVPVGAFLSGGIDSSACVSLMQEQRPGQVRTFTIGMQEEAFNEARAAARIAAHLKTSHTEQYISDRDAREVIPLLPDIFSEPFADSSQIPTYLVSKMTRQHVTVSLSGDGGDELFGGYNSYGHMLRVWEKARRIPLPLRRAGAALLKATPLIRQKNWGSRAALLPSKTPLQLYRNLYERDPLAAALPLCGETASYVLSQAADQSSRHDALHDFMLTDLCLYHPDDILVKVDRAAMAVSLETRIPLLDRDVVEFAWTLGSEYLRQGGVGKQVLRRVLARHVPAELTDGPKKGFAIPVTKWLKEGALRDWAEELLSEKKIKDSAVFDAAAVRTMWRAFTEEGRWRIQIWYLLMFQAWYDRAYQLRG